jgi:chorismate dehydratase
MPAKIRIGAVGYLNTRPLVFGLAEAAHGRIELSFDVPAVLADRLAGGEIDVGLIPTVELARIPDLEIVPGLGIVSRGAARSVLLVTRCPPERVERVALDPESRTSNALIRILYDELWNHSPEFEVGPVGIADSLDGYDAAVRIGDKALFEPLPEGIEGYDLGELWDRATGLPFVWAVWACRPGVLDDELSATLHGCLGRGLQSVDAIAREYTFEGRRDPELARAYLTRNIQFRLGTAELCGMKRFLAAAARVGAAPRVVDPQIGVEARAS